MASVRAYPGPGEARAVHARGGHGAHRGHVNGMPAALAYHDGTPRAVIAVTISVVRREMSKTSDRGACVIVNPDKLTFSGGQR